MCFSSSAALIDRQVCILSFLFLFFFSVSLFIFFLISWRQLYPRRSEKAMVPSSLAWSQTLYLQSGVFFSNRISFSYSGLRQPGLILSNSQKPLELEAGEELEVGCSFLLLCWVPRADQAPTVLQLFCAWPGINSASVAARTPSWKIRLSTWV